MEENIEYSKVINSTIEGIGSNSKAVGGVVGEQGWGPMDNIC